MRTARLVIPGVTYQLISRFVDRRWFFADNEERRRYLQLLGRALRDSDWICLAYALMSSHIHLAMIAGESPLEAWAKRAHTPFATWMNLRHDRIGSVFVRGPKDYAVPPGGIGKLIAYIHNNPVRAGVVEHAGASDWTSHQAYMGSVHAPDWLDVTRGFELSGFTNPSDFDEFVRSAPDDPTRVELGSLRRAVVRGRIVAMTPTVGDLVVVPLAARSCARFRVDPRWFVQQAAAVFGIEINELCSRRRTPNVVAARRVAVHSAMILGVVGADIAAALGLSESAVSTIWRKALTEPQARARDLVLERIRALTGAGSEDRPSAA